MISTEDGFMPIMLWDKKKLFLPGEPTPKRSCLGLGPCHFFLTQARSEGVAVWEPSRLVSPTQEPLSSSRGAFGGGAEGLNSKCTFSPPLAESGTISDKRIQ